VFFRGLGCRGVRANLGRHWPARRFPSAEGEEIGAEPRTALVGEEIGAEPRTAPVGTSKVVWGYGDGNDRK
jgi:hypothetical protein